MRIRIVLYLVTALTSVLLLFLSFIAWRFLLDNVARTRDVKIDVLQLPDVDIDRYNKIIKKGT